MSRFVAVNMSFLQAYDINFVVISQHTEVV